MKRSSTFSLRNTVSLVLAAALFLAPMSLAQQAGPQPPPAQTQQKPTVENPAAGGPQGEIGPIAIPKKKTEEEKPAPPPKPKNPEGLEDFSLRVDVPLVTLDALVVSKDGQFIPGLKKEHFRVLEDGVPQPIAKFEQTEAPITAVLLVEFAANNYYFMNDALVASYSFAETLKKEDWIAVVSYDMKPYMHVDFTQNKQAVFGALGRLRIPGFSETNLFDALYDTIDRMETLEGRKYIVLVSTGVDTFSKLTFDKILQKVKNTRDITIYAISTGQALRLWAENRGYMSAIANLDFLQADNQMNTFARLTGGKAYFPRFESEFPAVFRDIANTIRNQYSISYKPTNNKQDGTYRKVKVEVIDPATGKPLVIKNQKNKEVKYQVLAREGYRAKNVVE